MRNPVTIPLTKDRNRNIIISEENLIALDEDVSGVCYVTHIVNGVTHQEASEFTAVDLFEEICSPSK